MYEAGMITSIALFTLLGLVLTSMGVAPGSAEWWCVLGLFLAYGWHQHAQGRDSERDEINTLIQHARATLKEAEQLKLMAEQRTQNNKDTQ